MHPSSPTLAASPSRPASPVPAGPPFGVNEMRLNARQWLAVLAIVAAFVFSAPRLWARFETFDTGPDYRIPYQLSKDYWLYERWVSKLSDRQQIAVLGDSVVWGEYVSRHGTLSHFLGAESNRPDRFLNCAMNGLFPLALEGLVEHYASSLKHRKIILHSNVLWMSSPQADLSEDKEQVFNHSRLVPQFRPHIAPYRADAAERLSVVVERHVNLFAWVGHLQNAYFDQQSIPTWTLEAARHSSPSGLKQQGGSLLRRFLTMDVPGELENDPQRGPESPRHRSWTASGGKPVNFDWVALDKSVQWAAFQRLVHLLRERGNDVLVIVGPFNEHMIAPEQRPTFRGLRDGIAAWLASERVPTVVPPTLASPLYADASHPLTEGYAELARQISQDPTFRNWLAR
jgi:hypothetical protein